VNIQNCIGLRKKILELALIISVRNSGAEAFVLQKTPEENRLAALCFFSEKLENGGCR